MVKVLQVVVGLCVLLGSATVAKADGAAVYAAQCVACHGANGEGNLALSSPALAGQSAEYLQRQLTNFSTGLRGTASGDSTGAQMTAISSTLSSDDMQGVADYIAALPITPLLGEPANGDVKQGEKLYQSYCGSCHGSDAKGNDALHSPNLTLLSNNYLNSQYDKFLNGQRGYEKADKFGRQMGFMARAVTDPEQLKAITAYIHSLR